MWFTMSNFLGNVMKSDLYFENSKQNFRLIQTQIRFEQQSLTHNSNTKFYWTLSNNSADKQIELNHTFTLGTEWKNT